MPILIAPMASACPPALSIAVANAGGLGACGALPDVARADSRVGREGRAGTPGPFQLNPLVPDPLPRRDPDPERRVRELLAGWGPRVASDASDARLPDFAAAGQAAALAADELVGRIWRDARALLR